jgi:hypothetical protein
MIDLSGAKTIRNILLTAGGIAGAISSVYFLLMFITGDFQYINSNDAPTVLFTCMLVLLGFSTVSLLSGLGLNALCKDLSGELKYLTEKVWHIEDRKIDET